MPVFFTGTDALQIEVTVQNIFMDYVRSKINAVPSDYNTLLGSKVLVTNSIVAAGEAYRDGNGMPFILAMMPEYDEPYGRQTAGVMSQRYEMRIPLDGSMSDQASKRSQPGAAVDVDHKLMGCLRAIVERGYDDLGDLGLEHPQIAKDAESQTSSSRLNPYVFTCGVNTQTTLL